jgi:hypothetical protein
MRIRTKRILLIAGVVVLLAALSLAYQEYDERRTKREEDTLKGLVIDSFDVKDATLDEAVRLLVEKVHAAGHPELRPCVYANYRDAPRFHAQLNAMHLGTPNHRITMRLTSIPLVELVKYVGGLADSTCEVIGHDLLAVPTIGTTRPFRRATFKIYPDYFNGVPDKDLIYGLNFYEGMTVEIKRKQSKVEVFAPEEEIDTLEAIFLSARRPSWWEQAQSILRYGTTIPKYGY